MECPNAWFMYPRKGVECTMLANMDGTAVTWTVFDRNTGEHVMGVVGTITQAKREVQRRTK